MSQLNRTRVNNVLKRMAEAGVEQMIVTSPISIFYCLLYTSDAADD